MFEQQDDLAIGPQLTDVDSLGERIVGGLRAKITSLGSSEMAPLGREHSGIGFDYVAKHVDLAL